MKEWIGGAEVKATIHWNGFLNDAVQPDGARAEICGFLYSLHPFSSSDQWYVKRVGNRKDVGGFTPEWAPNKADMARVKKEAKQIQVTKIGNIHTHPHSPLSMKHGYGNEDGRLAMPSDTDLRFARRFNDLLRIIVAVNYPKMGSVGQVTDIVLHDQFGQLYSIELRFDESWLTGKPEHAVSHVLFDYPQASAGAVSI